MWRLIEKAAVYQSPLWYRKTTKSSAATRMRDDGARSGVQNWSVAVIACADRICDAQHVLMIARISINGRFTEQTENATWIAHCSCIAYISRLRLRFIIYFHS